MLKFASIVLILALAPSCRTKVGSDVRVANGLPAVDNQYNNPVQKVWDPTRNAAFCTLGFVHDQVAFTALHCVHEGNGLVPPSTIAVKLPNGQFAISQKIHASPEGIKLYTTFNQTDAQRDQLLQAAYLQDPSCKRVSTNLKRQIDQNLEQREREYMAFAGYDFAILVFPPGTGRAFVGDGPYYGLNPQLAKSARLTGVKHIGYGHDQALGERKVEQSCDERGIYSGFGERREGFNENMKLSQDGFLFETQGYVGNPRGQALTLGGDSGSIWVACYDNNDCNQMDAIAVTNGGAKQSDGTGSSIGPNLYSPLSINIMRAAVECGNNGPCAPKFRGYDETVYGKSSANEPEIAVLLTGSGETIQLSLGIKTADVTQLFVCAGDKVESDCKNAVTTKPTTLHDRRIFAKATAVDLKAGTEKSVSIVAQTKDQKTLKRFVKIRRK